MHSDEVLPLTKLMNYSRYRATQSNYVPVFILKPPFVYLPPLLYKDVHKATGKQLMDCGISSSQNSGRLWKKRWTSAETVWTTGDGEPRTSTSSFTWVPSSDYWKFTLARQAFKVQNFQQQHRSMLERRDGTMWSQPDTGHDRTMLPYSLFAFLLSSSLWERFCNFVSTQFDTVAHTQCQKTHCTQDWCLVNRTTPTPHPAHQASAFCLQKYACIYNPVKLLLSKSTRETRGRQLHIDNQTQGRVRVGDGLHILSCNLKAASGKLSLQIQQKLGKPGPRWENGDSIHAQLISCYKWGVRIGRLYHASMFSVMCTPMYFYCNTFFNKTICFQLKQVHFFSFILFFIFSWTYAAFWLKSADDSQAEAW